MDRRAKFAFIATFFVFIAVIYSFVNPYYQLATKTFGLSVKELAFGKITAKHDGDVINILILGIAGGTHDGPLLSDSIMIMQYNLQKNTLVSIALPRDVWSASMDDKINSAYAYGENEEIGTGLERAKKEIGSVVNMPLHYSAVINFSKFKQLIDAVGGVDIKVEQSFTDDEFPIEGKENDECDGDPNYACRYETITFNAGINHMDGETALKFVRSRHAMGSEGSDFARNKRQQLVINGLKTKAISVIQSDLRKNEFEKTKKLYAAIDTLVLRDISNNEAAMIAKNIVIKKNLKQTNLKLSHDVFEVAEGNEYRGRYALIPLNNDVTAFHTYMKCLFEKQNEKICEEPIIGMMQ